MPPPFLKPATALANFELNPELAESPVLAPSLSRNIVIGALGYHTDVTRSNLVWGTNGVFVSDVAASPTGYFFAPLQLPVGAVVDEIEFSWGVPSGTLGNWTSLCLLYKRNFNQGGVPSSTTVASQSTTSQTSPKTFSVGHTVVDESFYWLAYSWSSTTATGNISIADTRIRLIESLVGPRYT